MTAPAGVVDGGRVRGVGVDAVDVARFRTVLARRPGLVRRLFTDGERSYASRGADPGLRLAARFAAKEATLKALGVGIGAADFHEVEVVRGADGAPHLSLAGRAAVLAAARGVRGGTSHSPTPTWWPWPRWWPRADALKPVVTVAEMRAIDEEALAVVDHDVLVERAGTAVATAALRLLGGAYGRRVLVVAGKGTNGADGRVAAARLRRRGARVEIVEAAAAPDRVGPSRRGGPGHRRRLRHGFPRQLHGALGAGGGPGAGRGHPVGCRRRHRRGLRRAPARRRDGHLRRPQAGPAPGRRPPPGRSGRAWSTSVSTCTGPGSGWWRTPTSPACCRCGPGGLQVAVGRGRGGRLAGHDRRRRALRPRRLPGRRRHGPSRRARRRPRPVHRGEAVATELAADGWAAAALEMVARCHSVVVGPGLGRAAGTAAEVRTLVAGAEVPVVIDADGLVALGSGTAIDEVVRGAGPAGAEIHAILTPHDGEFASLTGRPPGADRIAATRRLAARTGAVVLLKGPTTVVAAPGGEALLATAGSPRLATAGTGDVLSGAIGAFVARGLPLLEAAGLAAHVHGRAAALGPPEGLVAGDLADLLGRWLSDIRRG